MQALYAIPIGSAVSGWKRNPLLRSIIPTSSPFILSVNTMARPLLFPSF
jgi:hypothetical protein